MDKATAAREAQATLAAAAASENRRISGELSKAQAKADESDAQAHGLKDELDGQREANKTLQAERDIWLTTDAGEATRRATSAWYAAVAGWTVATLIAGAWAASRWFLGSARPASARPLADRPPGTVAGTSA